MSDAKETHYPAKQTLNNRATEKRNGLKKRVNRWL